MDGKRVNLSPVAQSRARTVLNERRETVGMLPVYSDNELRAVQKRERLPEEKDAEPEPRRTATRHYVKRSGVNRAEGRGR
jgi:hypothetical protein